MADDKNPDEDPVNDHGEDFTADSGSDAPETPEEAPVQKKKATGPVGDAKKKAAGAMDAVMNSKPVKFARFASWVTGITPAFKVAAWGIKRKSNFLKLAVPFTAAAGLAAYLGVAAYGAAFAHVKWNDTNTFLNWPATEGQWTGKITRFSHKGTWPCDSWEGNLRTGEAADSEAFVIRKWDTALIEKIQNIPEGTDVTLTYRDNGLSQETFDNNSLYQCIQRGDHTAIDVTIAGGPR